MYAVSLSSFEFSKFVKILFLVAAFLALVSWNDAAQDQYDRMHDDDSGAACSMHIDY